MEINLSVKQANEKRGNTETAGIKLRSLGAQSGLQRKGETGPQSHPQGRPNLQPHRELPDRHHSPRRKF